MSCYTTISWALEVICLMRGIMRSFSCKVFMLSVATRRLFDFCPCFSSVRHSLAAWLSCWEGVEMTWF